MIKKKEEAELQAKQAEDSAPEFLKKLGNMKEKATQKPKKKGDEGPSIEDLDDGTDIPPWHRAGAPEKPEWVVLLLIAAAKEADEEEKEDEHVFVAVGEKSMSKLALEDSSDQGAKQKEDDQPAWMKQAKNLKSTPHIGGQEKRAKQTRRNSFDTSGHLETKQPWQNTTLKSPQTPKPTKQPAKPVKRTTPVRSQCKSASAALALADKPEWMKGAEAIRKKNNNPQQIESTKVAAAAPATDAQPEWMAKRSKIKDKTKDDAPVDADNSKKNIAKLTSATSEQQQQPSWMAQRSKIKGNPKDDSNPSKAEIKVKRKKSVSKSDKSDNQPAWMWQRSKIKGKAKEEDTEDSTEEKKSLPKSSPTNNEQPSWMAQRSKIKGKVKEDITPDPTVKDSTAKKSLPKAPPTNDQPAWMAQRSKIKGKPKEETPSESKEDINTKKSLSKTSSSSPDEKQPAWMAQRSKIKEKTKEEDADAKPLDDKPEQEQGDYVPAWMKQKLKPRVSVVELKSSSVTEKLENRPKLKKVPYQISKQDLMENVVQEKISKRPSIQAVKAEARKDEMEWMKAKLKPGGARKAAPAAETTPKEEDDGKPAWMKHKLKPRVSVQELQSSSVHEKLDSKQPIRQASIRLSKKELNSNVVKEKLAKRSSLLELKKSPIKKEEMEWMKKKLKSGNRNLLALPQLAHVEDKRPEWMREAEKLSQSKSGSDDEKEAKEPSGGPARTYAAPQRQNSKRLLAHEEVGDKRPAWMREAQKRIPSLRNLNVGDDDESEKPPEKLLPKRGSMRRIATMPAQPATPTGRAVRRRSSMKLVATDNEASGPKVSNSQSASDPAPEPEISPFDLFPIKRPVGDKKLSGSISSIKSGNSKGSSGKKKGRNSKNWNSMADLGHSTTDDSDDSSSTSSGSDMTDATDWSGSTNDMGVTMGDSSDRQRSRSKPSEPSLLKGNPLSRSQTAEPARTGRRLSRSKTSDPDLLKASLLGYSDKKSSEKSKSRSSSVRGLRRSSSMRSSKSTADKKKTKKREDRKSVV